MSRYQEFLKSFEKSVLESKRNIEEIELIAVSKRQSIENILSIINEGHLCFGENQIQEVLKKWPEIKGDHPKVKTHFIGTIQSKKLVDITQSWSTVTNNGEEHPVHFHPNSYLSGVMFVKSSDDSSPLLLHNNIKLPSISLDLYDGKESNIPPNEFASVTASTFSVAPTEGSIVLFPSLTPHGVCKSRSKDERIIIAFNTFPRLPFGCEKETNLVMSRI